MIPVADALKFGLGALVGASLVIAPAYIVGKREGRQAAAADAISNTVLALQERNATDEKIFSSTLDGLCAYFGLSDAERLECVRRLEKANANAGNSSANSGNR